MHSRLKELGNEAGLPTYNPEGMPTKLGKFAELVIRDCIEINKQELSFNAFEQLQNKYRDHFGVEL